MGIFLPRVADENRKVFLGEPTPNFYDNKVDTTKYNLLTFLPKSILLQFLRLSNIVFLINAVLQSIPIISSLSPITAIGPLGFVLLVSILREGYEDYKRHKKDWQMNSRETRVLQGGQWVERQWDELQVGDYVKILNGQIVPADILLLHSSEQNSICYVETATLDGQSNLKQKYAFTETIRNYPQQFQKMRGYCLVDLPKANLYQFSGEIKVNDLDTCEVGFQNLVVRQTVLKNTDEVVGIALYCGYDTKILKNQGQVHHKISKVEHRINYIQVGLLIVLVVLCGGCSLGYFLVNSSNHLRQDGSYVTESTVGLSAQSGLTFFTIFLMLNFLIPITLNIVMDGIKAFSGLFLSMDRKMYDPLTKKWCGILNTSVMEELGVVDCILTDKTGTLTANQMVFKAISINDRVYTRESLEDNLQFYNQDMDFEQFWLSVVVCHDVVRDQKKDQYQGSSPDQVCFINFANSIGYTFNKRTKNYIELVIQGQKKVYELVDIIPFSPRKRMSVLVIDPARDQQIIVFTKGADSCVFQKAHPHPYEQALQSNLGDFAKQGLRTLVFAKRVLSVQQYRKIKDKQLRIKQQLKERLITKQQHAELERAIVEQIESKMSILGVTGIEDRLQDDVPQTISRLQRAGIIVMMITGDKLETAENIGYLSQMIKEDYKIARLSSQISDIRQLARQIIFEIQQRRRPLSVIIEGKQIASILNETDPYFIDIYARILFQAKSVIFCRSSPKEKAQIVKFVKNKMGSIVLAIGDGGNDVGMIEEANIGIGIIGKEGNSAAGVSDFSFGKFRFLDRIVLHHGRWFYYRMSYFFIFFGWKNVIITFIIFFYLTQSAFSGTFNYTQGYYLLYNSFFAIAVMVHFGLYEQDINDDLQPVVWPYMPEMYKQYKRKDLFSYTRYAIWFMMGVVTAGFIFLSSRLGIDPLGSIDSDGHPPDLDTLKLQSGMTLYLAIVMIIFFDHRSHTYFLDIFVFHMLTLVFSIVYFIVENTGIIGDLSGIYTDNLVLKIYFKIFLIGIVPFLIKIAWRAYSIDQDPDIIDQFVLARDNQVKDLDAVLRRACAAQEKKYQKQIAKLKDDQDGSRKMMEDMVVQDKSIKMSQSGIGDINTLEARVMKLSPSMKPSSGGGLTGAIGRDSSSTFVGSFRPVESALMQDTTNNMMVSKELRIVKPASFRVQQLDMEQLE